MSSRFLYTQDFKMSLRPSAAEYILQTETASLRAISLLSHAEVRCENNSGDAIFKGRAY